MGALAAGQLLHLWERADGLGPVERALSLAEAAGADPEVLRSRPSGRTNERVLTLRETLIGPALDATASCPACGSRVEFSLDSDDLRDHPPAEESEGLVTEEYLVDWRPPTPGDLLEAADEEDAGLALRRRCLTVSSSAAEPVDPAALSDDVLDLVEKAMVEADPLAEVLVALACPDCQTDFESDLDLGAFVWAEVEARARRVLHEVDVLARTYGWTEPDVLALSEGRRAAYVRMALDGGP